MCNFAAIFVLQSDFRYRSEMNGRLVGTKELYVSFHQAKEDRRALLTTVHSTGQQSKKVSEEKTFEGFN